MDVTPPTPGPVPELVAFDDGDRTGTSSRMLTVGLPAMLAVAALGGTTFLMGSGDAAVRTGELAATSTTSTTSIVEDIFTSRGVTVESTAPTTRATTTTPATVATTTTTTTMTPATTTPAPTTPATVATTRATTRDTPVAVAGTLPEQPPQPIAPPADPRGADDEIRLGGISIPKLGVDAPLLEGIRLATLDVGPGHWPGTAMPGDIGNVVVAAHRTSHGGPFRNIDQLVAGDAVLFDTAAGTLEYTVTGTQVVNPDDTWIVDPTDTATATLFACHPPGSVRQRIVVHLELAS